MYNSRSTNICTEDPDTEAADSEDLDALLRDDVPDADAENATADSKPDDIVDEGQFARLELRAQHANSSLQNALSDVCELQQLADEERLTAGRFVAEMCHWDRMISELENYTGPATNDIAEPAEDELTSDDESRVAELMRALQAQEEKIQALESRLHVTDKPIAQPRVNRLLIVTSGDKNYKYPLTEPIITMGRSKKNDIQLRSSHASRHHARVLSDDNGAYIEDTHSANGVMVNSRKIKRQQLHSGDIILAGRIQIKYIDLMEGSSGEGKA